MTNIKLATCEMKITGPLPEKSLSKAKLRGASTVGLNGVGLAILMLHVEGRT